MNGLKKIITLVQGAVTQQNSMSLISNSQPAFFNKLYRSARKCYVLWEHVMASALSPCNLLPSEQIMSPQSKLKNAFALGMNFSVRGNKVAPAAASSFSRCHKNVLRAQKVLGAALQMLIMLTEERITLC
jgi:hypothetical protein